MVPARVLAIRPCAAGVLALGVLPATHIVTVEVGGGSVSV